MTPSPFAEPRLKRLTTLSGLKRALSGLAPFWLKDDPLIQSAKLSDAPGNVVALYAVDESFLDKIPARAHLASGLVLPLLWRDDRERHSSRLPESLHHLADEALQRARAGWASRGEAFARRWTLHPAEALGNIDLSALPLEGRSPMAPLVAGLVVAALGGRPKTHVFATGDVSEHGVEAINPETLRHKLDALERLRAHGVFRNSAEPLLFLPRANQPSPSAPKHTVTLKPYRAASDESGNLVASFNPHLAALQTEPDLDDPLEVRLAYANQPHIDDPKFYTDRLLVELALELRARWLERAPEPIERLVLGVGPGRHEMALLTLMALQPRQSRLICTHESTKNAAQTRQRIQDSQGDADTLQAQLRSLIKRRHPLAPELAQWLSGAHAPEPVEPLEMENGAALVARLRDWLNAAPDARRAVELTAGNTTMKAAAVWLAHTTRSKTLVLETKTNPKARRPQYGTEEFALIPWWGTSATT